MLHLGENLAGVLSHLHSLTGCDTTSYFYGVGKVKVIRKCIKEPESLDLLTLLGKDTSFTEDEEIDVSTFVKNICYNGKENETLIETKIRLYNTKKSSLPLPPNPKSLKQALWVYHQVYW